jgi:hypothetical protein
MGFLTGRLMRTLRPAVTATVGLGSEYRQYWEESNERARQADGPLWVAVVDSTAQGIGASAPDRGYARGGSSQRHRYGQWCAAFAEAIGLDGS